MPTPTSSPPTQHYIELLRDALDHIMRTARASATQTRRLRWIVSRAQGALDGRPYIESEHELPADGEARLSRLLYQNGELRKANEFATSALEAIAHSCDVDTLRAAVELARSTLAQMQGESP